MRAVLHSVSYAGVWPGQARLSLEEFVPRAASLGYSEVMLVAKRPHLSPLDYPTAEPGRRRELRSLIEGHGLKVACLAAYTDFTVGPDRPDVPFWEHQVLYVAELAALAQALDCPIVRVFTGYERPGLSYAAAWGRVVESLRECARAAARHGVTLAVQNHHDLAAHHESLAELLVQVDHPSCRAAFDAWSPTLQGLRGESLAEAVRKLAPFIAYTTVADYVALPRYSYKPELVNYVAEPSALFAVPVGEGMVDYSTFLSTLRECGYDGPVAYELCSPLRGGGSLENLDACAKLFLDYLKTYQG